MSSTTLIWRLKMSLKTNSITANGYAVDYKIGITNLYGLANKELVKSGKFIFHPICSQLRLRVNQGEKIEFNSIFKSKVIQYIEKLEIGENALTFKVLMPLNRACSTPDKKKKRVNLTPDECVKITSEILAKKGFKNIQIIEKNNGPLVEILNKVTVPTIEIKFKAKVENLELFHHAWINGIGRDKKCGFGMLRAEEVKIYLQA